MSQPITLKASPLHKHLAFMQGNILVLTVTQALGTLSRCMAFPYASLFILALGGSPKQIGIVTALSPLAGLLMFPIGGHLADHAGRVKLIALGGYLSSAVLLLYVLAPSWQLLALAAFLRGFIVFHFPPTSAIIADSLTPEDRGKGIATMNTISGVVGLIAPYLAGLILEAWGDETGARVLYGTMTVVYFINTVINHRFLKETSTNSHPPLALASLTGVFREAYAGIPALLKRLPTAAKALTAIVILMFIANAVASPYWVVYARDEIGLSTTDWGLILLIEMVVRSLLYLPAGIAVDKYGRVKFIRAALLISGLAVPAYAIATGFTHVLLIRMVIAVANTFFLCASSAMMADALPRDIRGRAMAALGRGTVMLGASSGGTGGPGLGFLVIIPVMLASLLGGYLYSYNATVTWLAVMAVSAVSLTIAVAVLRDAELAEV
jgi:MFS family permease